MIFLHFKKINDILKNNGYIIEFRPHPYEDITNYKKIFNVFNKEKKENLLSESKKIFMGFTSSILYEAKHHGHIVLELDTSFIDFHIDTDFTASFSEKDYPKIPQFLYNFDPNNIINKDALSLKDRFNHILNIIEKN